MAGLSQTHAEWLEGRSLSVEVAAEMGCYSAGPNVAFPYILNGKELYAKHRHPKDKSRTRCVPAGVEQTSLWNEDCLLDEPLPTDVLIITEGEPDAIAVKQSGFQFVVSLPSGAANTEQGCRSKAERALTVADESGQPILKSRLLKFKRICLLTDCDHDGLLMRAALASVLGDEFCWLPEYPEGCKDANEVGEKYGDEAVRRLVDEAQPMRSDGFLPLTEIANAARPKTYSTGLPWLDPHILLTRPEFFVIAGTAGAGKSTVAQRLAMGLAWEHRMPVSIFNGEGHESILLQRARRFWAGMNPSVNLGDTQKQAERDFWIRHNLALVKPPQDQLPTFDWLIWAMERQALDRKRQVFLLDPWNEIMHERGKHTSLTEYTGECIIKMKRLADRHKLILMVAHHVKKPENPKAIPSPYDIADSAHWYNKADHCLIVHRPDEGANKTLLYLAKSKDHEIMGRPGKVWASMSSEPFNMHHVIIPDEPKKDAA